MGRQGLSEAIKPSPIFFAASKEDPRLKEWQKKVTHASNRLDEIIKEAKNLPQAYEARKSFLSQFFTANRERSDAISFVVSIAASFESHMKVSASASENTLIDLTDRTRTLKGQANVISGAYLLVMKTIENSYGQAYVSKDPHSSQLYLELSKKLGTINDKQQRTLLKALNTYLNSEPGKQIKFGTLTNDAIMLKIETAITEIAPKSSVKPGM